MITVVTKQEMVVMVIGHDDSIDQRHSLAVDSARAQNLPSRLANHVKLVTISHADDIVHAGLISIEQRQQAR